MTLSDINRIADLIEASGRKNVPVPLSIWKEMQMARIGAATVKTDPKTGKSRIKPVDKTPKPLAIGKKAKADRTEKALKANREKRKTA